MEYPRQDMVLDSRLRGNDGRIAPITICQASLHKLYSAAVLCCSVLPAWMILLQRFATQVTGQVRSVTD
jgi:hypothetical protein